jgi:drug/metabolite transporter (DMT)-like permease
MARLSRLGGWLYQQPYLLVSFTYLVWAINVVLGRYAAGHIPPVTLTLLRWGVAALILLPFAWPYLKRDWPPIRANFGFVVFLAITGTSGFAILSYWGMHYTQALNGLLIQCTMPILVGCMSYVLIGERLSLRQMAGIALSMAGVMVVLFRGNLDVLHTVSFNRGDLLCIGSALVFASYSALVKRRPAMHPISFLAVTIAIGAVVTIPLSLWEITKTGAPPIDWKTIWIVLFVAIFPSIIAYICYNRGVELIGPNRTVALYPLIIVFGALIAIVFLGERPQPFHLVGTLLIVCGVLLATRQSRAAAPAAT